jgi:hypothetical protein
MYSLVIMAAGFLAWALSLVLPTYSNAASALKDRLEAHLGIAEDAATQHSRQLAILLHGVACLYAQFHQSSCCVCLLIIVSLFSRYLYVQANWTGPDVPASLNALRHPEVYEREK